MMTVLSNIPKKKQKLKNNISTKEVSSNDDGVDKDSKNNKPKAENIISNKEVSSNDDGVEKEPKKNKTKVEK